MRLAAFRIKNFRSILDSEWVPFSPDGITVLVGQNESGKSSVLEALYFALSADSPTQDDFRIGAELPEVHLRIEIDPGSIAENMPDLSEAQALGLKSYLEQSRRRVDLAHLWRIENKEGKRLLASKFLMLDERLDQCVELARVQIAEKLAVSSAESTANSGSPSSSSGDSEDDEDEGHAEADIAVEIWEALPLGVLFNESSGRLPNQVDIDEEGRPIGEGARAAKNFLQIADVDLPALLHGDRRARENTLNRANNRVSRDFNNFWSQTIGKAGRLSLKCDLDHYPQGVTEKAGKPHLVFWICDGNTQLYPKQRSQGVRWFLSFYLQLKASEKARNRRVFLLDEPGANLHSKAQGDVLKLIDKLGKDTSTVVYSTHSPQMLEYKRLFRVHAVQRSGDMDDSPTQIIDAHRLGTASSDTLSPVLSAMGADLSHHQVIQKTNNVLLEEMSAYYYLSAFWKLLDVSIPAHFIAATGVNKIETLANMFRGWGLDFISAFDDDKQGREAYKSMKRELYGDDEVIAAKKMVRFRDLAAIEDVFSREDFAKYIAKEELTEITGSNSEYVKSASRSKPVLAFHFAIAVDNNEIHLESLSSESQQRIRCVVEAITSRL